MQRYRVQLFAVLKEKLGCDFWHLETEKTLTARELLGAFFAAYPDVAALRSTTRLAVNHQFSKDEIPLAFEDEIALIPPVSGG